MKSTNEIRSAFLNYFKDADHEVVASSPLVPDNDPTLMFVNAGMVPFKNVFTGMETRPYDRATTSQKCVRAGGKHNDLDNVGYTARHHTFFEMLGNFSFGDYFKEKAIFSAWDLITNVYGIDASRLLVTVYHDDDEAFDLWKKISGLPEDRIIRIATNDNFWSMGNTGPCGPCSEIFYDHGDHIWGGPPGTPEEDGDRFVEIWNLVFMQFDQQEDGTRVPLPKPSIDTGMGLERIAAVLQGTHDNYETDLFKKLIEASAEHSGVEPYGDHNTSHRVIADHLRSTSFLIADGVLPSNEGRGYVLRRIMRRAMRHAHMIGCKEPLMHRLVPALVGEMGQAFPELVRAEALIAETLLLEEKRFRKTLDRGMRLLDEALENMSAGGVLDGEIAFKLYDTYGFPLDLTQDALRTKDMTVDEEGFNAAMERQKAEARAAWKGSGSSATEAVWFEAQEEFGGTDFVGYSTTHAEGKVLQIVSGEKVVDNASEGDDVSILVNQTPFYGESGGQVGDIGTFKTESGALVEITDTEKKLGALHIHVGKVTSGSINKDDVVEMQVDVENRDKIRANHSVTHIIHAALRNKLGDHLTQKGSLVSADRMRFDISHSKAVTADEIKSVEDEVNQIIRQNTEVTTRLMTPEEAIEAGAMALFGEKYGDEVRVVAMGKAADGKDYSVELCGGTHVKRTGDIGYCKVISEGAVSAGVRRLEVVTGQAACDYSAEQENYLTGAVATVKSTPSDLQERLNAILTERKAMEKEIADLQKKVALGGGNNGGDDVKEVNGIKFLGQVLEGIPAKELRGLADDAKKRLGSGVIAFVAVNDGKAAVLTAVTDDLKDKISAVDLVRVGADAVGGKGGGGRPDMAQAGGPDGANAAEAITKIEGMLN
ncbi:alanine--tRNA ligase [Pseudemcibacter aquimaris]|uniref:alanine--tRNA ligase n=1 Tax=Pseudemcibacter aquimaris TaxID=2857064 RepID=UPI002013B82D|nr:alanine--tRNA ligase [Pseudemcibacter aquimaris]MCC3860833.1 alanine--tRNA ligase [Pseudemcibacter aquimaris]WDU59652.1 alanine--tRNA ligase [Pseudemcibacter aquimaris]